jgi:hypothetical protein
MRALFVVLACALIAPSTAAASDPALDGRERWMLGAINKVRAEHGLAPKQASMSLNRAAADFAQYLHDTGSDDHYADGRSPSQRAIAAGWPGAGAGEILAGGQAPGALNAWMNSGSHRNAILDPTDDPVGVGVVATTWIVDFGDACPQLDGAPHPGCELTGDYGDTNQDIWRLEAEDAAARGESDWAWDAFCPDMWDPKPAQCAGGSDDEGGSSTAPRRSPRLSLSAKRRGRVVTVRVRTVRKAAGRVRVTASRNGKRVRARRIMSRSLHGGRREQTYRVKLEPGAWKLTAKFSGRGSWKTAARSVRVRVR